ncbi:integrase, partial [Campylobacter jejuni]|nr:integrase [Campylobacter jejuni]
MWINANIFCDNNSIGLRNLQKKSKKAIESNEKILHIDTKIFSYRYTQGKGRGGKTLQIWSKPLSKEEAQLVEQGFNIEDISNTTISSKTTQEVLSKALNDDVLLKNSKALQVQNTDKTKLSENQIQINKDSLSLFAKASSKKQNLALQKAAVVKEWLHAKGKISTNDFINYINAKKIYEFKLTQNKLFAWQKEYLANGLDALIDKRENKKDDAISALGIKELFINT